MNEMTEVEQTVIAVNSGSLEWGCTAFCDVRTEFLHVT
jgi:hypothetical protein